MLSVVLNKCEPFISYGFWTTNVTHNNDQYPFSKEHLRHRFGEMWCVYCTLVTIKAKQKKHTQLTHKRRQLHMLIAFDKTLHVPSVHQLYPYRTITIATTTKQQQQHHQHQHRWGGQYRYPKFNGSLLAVRCCFFLLAHSYTLEMCFASRSFVFIHSTFSCSRRIFHFVCAGDVMFVCFLFFVAFSIDARTECSLSLSVKFMRVKTA